jgi:hypothetical protein
VCFRWPRWPRRSRSTASTPTSATRRRYNRRLPGCRTIRDPLTNVPRLPQRDETKQERADQWASSLKFRYPTSAISRTSRLSRCW